MLHHTPQTKGGIQTIEVRSIFVWIIVAVVGWLCITVPVRAAGVQPMDGRSMTEEDPVTVHLPALSGKAPTQNVLEVMEATNEFNTFVRALRDAGLADQLAGEGPFTILAVDSADLSLLAFLPGGLPIKDGKVYLGPELLRRHILPGAYTRSDLTDGLSLMNQQGTEIMFAVSDGAGYFGLVTDELITADELRLTEQYLASNGVIHDISSLLFPR